ncbi:MAG: PQQ-binding-like beta-propeller repeat protein [Planctomycetes bacterium]|nr:PQQ-binding-like beta-propeller repeat protein [Planctomycetota bacterium]
MPRCSPFWLLLILATVATAEGADDWPTFRHDVGRSGSTTSALQLPLQLQWHVTPAAPPQPAWPAPAAANIYAKLSVLHPSETADRAPHVVIVGDRCWYASSATDTVYCRKLTTGELLWAYTAGAPVRLPPSVADDRVYIAADDGWVHCLTASTGKIVWQTRIGPEDRWLPGNSRLISRWPVRCGPLTKDGQVYVAAGVFPGDGAFLSCLDAKSGKVVWRQTTDIVASGPMLASHDRLFVQALRSQPNAFELANGKRIGPVAGGGSLAAVWKSQLVSGPNEIGKITGIDNAVLGVLPDKHQFQFTTRGAELYAASQQVIVAVDSERRVRWKKPRKSTRSLIAAAEVLVAGGDGEVAAYRMADGKQVWQEKIEGSVLGLSVAGGRLLVSTDLGGVYCYASAPTPSGEPKSPVDSVVHIQFDGPIPLTPPSPISPPTRLLHQELDKIGYPMAGYALLIEPPQHDLLFALAQQSSLQIVAVYRDTQKVREARSALRGAGLIGTRATAIEQPATWSGLPAQAFNLIVAFPDPKREEPPVAAWNELLQPFNGTLVVVASRKAVPIAKEEQALASVVTIQDWVLHLLRARPAAGLGEWSHPYADPGNTACSQDAVVKGPFEIQWFGPPGPQHMVDRHNRTSPPLFRGGRLFIPGMDRLTAVDAYNGTVLWEQKLPGATRLAVSRNTGHIVAGPEHVYVAREGECVMLSAATGQAVRTLKIPEAAATLPEPAAGDKEWGYLALSDDVLLGSVSTSDQARRKLTQQSWEQGYMDHQPLVVSEMLFARRPISDSKLWEYRPQGAIINTALAAGNGHVYFVESADPETLKSNKGRVQLAKLLGKGAHLVALRTDTGRESWRQPLSLEARHILFLSLTGKKLVLSGSRNDGAALVSDLVAHDADSGRELWKLSQPTGLKIGGSHGEQDQHPLVVGDTLFYKTFSCDLATGKLKKDWRLPMVGCGALSASLHSTFYRAGSACYADLGDSQNRELTGVTRPGCWLNMLPAGGLVLAPESSSGCTCAQYSVQTSLALRPLAGPAPDVLAGFEKGKLKALSGDIEFVGRLRVALKAPDPETKIRYSLDGTWPSSNSPLYEQPLLVERAATLFARTYRGDQPGGITKRNLRCVEVPRLTSPTTTLVTSAKIQFARYPGEAVIRYELDGRSPTAQSPVYEKPVEVTGACQLRAAYFAGSDKLGDDLAVEFRKVPGRLPDRPQSVQPGLAYEYFEVDGLTQLPNMDQLKPVRTGVIDRLTVPPVHRPDSFAVRYRGYLEIPADGIYSFRLMSDDGSELKIGDEVLISHDGMHDARSERQATIPLAAGKHRIELRYFDGMDKEVLLLRYGKPGTDRNEIHPTSLWHD